MKYLLIVFFIWNICQADELRLEFISPPLKIEKRAGQKLTISIDGLLNTIEGGFPGVPLKTYFIALKPTTKINKIDFIPSKKETIKGELSNQSSQVPLCTVQGRKFLAADSPYFKTRYYPDINITYSIHTLHGVEILIIRLYPVVYDTREKTLTHYKEGRIIINFSRNQLVKKFTLRQWQLDELKSLVENPELLDNVKIIDTLYDYLIITTSKLTATNEEYDLSFFQKHLLSKNINSKILTIEEINSISQGNDIEEKIRNAIKKEYEISGIRYVLLLGDAEESDTNGIKARKLWSKVRGYLNGSWKWVEENIPSDFYYSCLDGSFDGNGNNKWGEPDDGINGTDVDLLCEVTVGRASIENGEELKNFINKTFAYSTNPSTKSTLLLGEELFPELNLYGDDYMEQLIGLCKDHNYETSGYGPDWHFVKLYDRIKNWSGNDVLLELEKGSFSMVNHLGHSYKYYNMKLNSIFSTPNFKNNFPFFYYTQGCFPGDFTYDDSFIEKLIYHKNGAVAAIANTSYGLAPEDPEPETTKTPGASQMLHRKFIDGIFYANFDSFGFSHKKSKEFFIGLSNFQEMRWAFWVANYFGDPSITLQ